MLRLKFEEVQNTLEKVLYTRNCPPEHARKVSYEMARNSLEGTYTHGVNRFPRLIWNIDEGIVNVEAKPVLVNRFGALANYDGKLGLGITNAWFCMEQAIAQAKEYGIGLVALRNTNHWMRAATYGYQACAQGMAAICFTNTIPNMPTWGAIDSRIGNNPLVMAFPREKGDVVVDMSMSQFSYGALELAQLEGRRMSIDAGYDEAGELTRDPSQVLKTRRILPTGYWKGAALSVVMDLLAGGLALGNTTAALGRLGGDEHGVSQVFIAINIHKIAPPEEVERIADEAVRDLLSSRPIRENGRIVYPGERSKEIRAENLKAGIPIDERIWATITSYL
ncbi:MAG: 3-dehydro-L-gulonate 2-dehydrogenase [Firmicutes bacterium]|nr:3-dehydro-L-gulonate 2-dehydrogenase [Bacillota bacterium]